MILGVDKVFFLQSSCSLDSSNHGSQFLATDLYRDFHPDLLCLRGSCVKQPEELSRLEVER